ncbi:conjugative transposon protein TraN [Hymenobacter sp. YC55]|uniref:conjugative transposon protein TraN n=1 Tax=Hymenobacter sp. YC55 TaxID=3034019 RepID=UPI0023F77DC1|nr:conjugative transposon protein TraN [Hymenobacter sp. YC55]MDF7815099.1 conjugative transposon protein TraN [Hymenobacter sp. YC55]
MSLLPTFARVGLLVLTVGALPAPAQHASARRSMTPAQLLGNFSAPAAPAEAASAGPKILRLEEQNYIGSYHLGVGFQKTTHLIFPYAVTYVDLGNAGIIADKAQGAENIVKLKANQPSFPQTNMTVVTADGQLYSFLVDYEANPRVLTYNLTTGTGAASPTLPLALFSPLRLTQPEMENYARLVLKKKRMLRTKQVKDDITLALPGMYTTEELFFLPVYMLNKSNINYDVDFLKFYIRDKKLAKRTAIQESEVAPVFIYNAGQTVIPGPGGLDQVYVLRKFTIPDDKNLVVEMFERGGGRHLTFNVSNDDILKARKLKR